MAEGDELQKCLRSIDVSTNGKELRAYLEDMRDAPLMTDKPEHTAHRVGQRDMALYMLDLMEGSTDE